MARKEEQAEKNRKLFLNAAEIIIREGDEGTKDPLDILIAREDRMIMRRDAIMDAALNQRHWDEYLKAEKQDPAS